MTGRRLITLWLFVAPCFAGCASQRVVDPERLPFHAAIIPIQSIIVRGYGDRREPAEGAGPRADLASLP